MPASTWKRGPLPADTYMWGGVVPHINADGTPFKGDGFYFADFCGDHVIICPDGRKLLAHEVAMYNNCLELPSGMKGRAS